MIIYTSYGSTVIRTSYACMLMLSCGAGAHYWESKGNGFESCVATISYCCKRM